MTLQAEDVPRVKPDSRVEITNLDHGFYRVLAHYGFKESPRVPELLELCAARGLQFDLSETTFFVGREALITTNGNSMATWRKKLFDWLSRNARRATDSFALPADRVVELGVQIEI
jgi:KUP system potassium uptake protein